MNELFEKMQHIVDRYVKHYKDDFIADKEIIRDIMDDSEHERYLFWIVRKCGTNIGYRSSVPTSAVYDYYMSSVENNGIDSRYYEIDLKKNTVSLIRDKKSYLAKCKQLYIIDSVA